MIERAGEGQQPGREHDRRADNRHETANAAEQSRQREGAEARGALMIAFLARLPAAFEADEQADGQCDGEAAKQLFLIHLLTCVADIEAASLVPHRRDCDLNSDATCQAKLGN